MAANLRKAGHDVAAWNRTAKRAAALADAGVRIMQTSKVAADGAEIVIAMGRDDAASQSVWQDPETGAFAGMAEGTLGIECSTLSPQHVGALHAAAAARGLSFLDGPVAGSRPQAEAAQLIFMVGGDADDFACGEPILDTMGAAVHHAGGPGAGADVKLLVNTLFASQVATAAGLLGLARRSGIDPSHAKEILGATPVTSPAAKLSGGAMLAGAFAPAFPIDLVRKELGLAASAGDAAQQGMPMTKATAAIFDRAADDGYGADNIMGIASLYLTTSKGERTM